MKRFDRNLVRSVIPNSIANCKTRWNFASTSARYFGRFFFLDSFFHSLQKRGKTKKKNKSSTFPKPGFFQNLFRNLLLFFVEPSKKYSAGREAICRWLIRRHTFRAETRVGFPPYRSSDKSVEKRYLKSRPPVPFTGSIVMVTAMFSEIHPTRMKCHFASSHHFRTSHREYFVGGMRAATVRSTRPLSLSFWLSLYPCSLSSSSFVIWFRGSREDRVYPLLCT